MEASDSLLPTDSLLCQRLALSAIPSPMLTAFLYSALF